MADIKHWNVCTKKTYKKGDEERAFWPQVGQLTYFPAYQDRKASFKLELNMHPDTAFYVFEQTKKEDKPRQESVNEDPQEAISAEDVPF